MSDCLELKLKPGDWDSTFLLNCMYRMLRENSALDKEGLGAAQEARIVKRPIANGGIRLLALKSNRVVILPNEYALHSVCIYALLSQDCHHGHPGHTRFVRDR